MEGDPRIPWQNVPKAGGGIANAANGTTPWVRQQKYLDDGADIALAKGTEMLLIRAEAALRDGDVAGAMDLVNQVRAYHELEPVAAATAAEAWPILQDERGKTMWLEGRRFWDLRRWSAESGPAHNTLPGREGQLRPDQRERAPDQPQHPVAPVARIHGPPPTRVGGGPSPVPGPLRRQ